MRHRSSAAGSTSRCPTRRPRSSGSCASSTSRGMTTGIPPSVSWPRILRDPSERLSYTRPNHAAFGAWQRLRSNPRAWRLGGERRDDAETKHAAAFLHRAGVHGWNGDARCRASGRYVDRHGRKVLLVTHPQALRLRLAPRPDRRSSRAIDPLTRHTRGGGIRRSRRG